MVTARRTATAVGAATVAVALSALGFARWGAVAGAQEPAGASEDRPAAAQDQRKGLVDALAAQGVAIDFAEGAVSVEARVLVRDQLLEYVLVSPWGSAHESLFVTDASPTALHTAALLVGFAPGRNARWIPDPRSAELGSRGRAYRVLPPEHAPDGPPLYPYVGWRAGDEVYFYRLEDLIADLDSGRAMRRHGWVYLGSRELPASLEGAGGFAAERVGNLMSVCFFSEGDVLATAALPECEDQTIWTANPWLVPERDTPVRFVLSTRPIDAPSDALRALLPSVPLAGAGDEGR